MLSLDRALFDAAPALDRWFLEHGSNSQMELEAKLKDVDEHTFHAIRERLDSNPAWAARSTVVTVDTLYPTKLRGTAVVGVGGVLAQPSFEFKEKAGTLDVSLLDTDDRVRFSLSSEEPGALPAGALRPHLYRWVSTLPFL